VIEIRLAPDQLFGVVREELHTSLRHNAVGDAGDREARPLLATFGRDRAAHIDERQYRETGSGQPLSFECGIGRAEGGKMEPDVTREPLGELLRERRIGCGGEDLEITAPEHHAPVPGTRRDGIAVDAVGLGCEWGQPETATLERLGGCVHCRHEMGDMVEKDRARLR